MLTPYRDWSPTSLDIRGLNCKDQQNWLVAPVILTRDSDALERSNWQAFLDILAEQNISEDDYEETYDRLQNY